MTWNIEDPQGNESAKCKYDIVKYTRGRGLDLGCGPFKTYPHFIGVDNGHHAKEFGWQMKPDMMVDDCADLSIFNAESMDFVFSSHLLEHIEDYRAALKEWWRVLKVGGYLVLYLPHKHFYPNVGEEGANPDHKHDFVPRDIQRAMIPVDGKWDLVVNEERNGGMEYSFLQVYKKLEPGVGVYAESWTKRPGKSVCVVRYGGFGDMLQAAALFPSLKRDGYHITVMTTPKGKSVIENDPHVDDWFIQDHDQVPNHELTDFWAVQRNRFDKFINLSETIEGTLLAMPGRANHAWPPGVRHKMMDRNYLEFTFEVAELAFDPDPHFYPTEDEIRAVASSELLSGDKFVVMWALAGSSHHKFYPHQDAVIARIMMEMPDAHVMFVGDEACRLLEQGWENEPRVHRMSGELSIRETLTWAQRVNCVVGPETGVLNAVGFEEGVAKVCMLSHSSHENLTRDWKNSISIRAPFDLSVPICHNMPCHRLHFGNEYCPVDPDIGAAACAVSLHPDAVFAAVEAAYNAWKGDGHETIV